MESSGAVALGSARFLRFDFSSSMRGGSSISRRMVKSSGSGTLELFDA